MAVINGLQWTFNTVAAEYDRWAPGYPAALYEDLLTYKPMDADSAALEIGIGTGQATAPILKTGCTLTAVELGDELARLAGEKFAAYPNFSVVNLPFEQFSCLDGSFDLIYSAGAFHWINEEYGYSTVYRMLKPGGAFARFAKHPDYRKDDPALWEDMQKVYRQYMSYSAPSAPYTEEKAAARAQTALKYGFTQAEYHLYERARTYTAGEYTALIATYSDHVALPEESRPGFYDGIAGAIERHGGQITLHDVIDIQLARKL